MKDGDLMKSLIIEDDFVSGKLLEKMLKKYGESVWKKNPEEGISVYKENIEKKLEKFNVVCLDIMMPEMNGHEVLKKIREIERESNILEGVKIIMTTALGDFKNIKEAYSEQCDGYIVKPIERENLEEQLRKNELID